MIRHVEQGSCCLRNETGNAKCKANKKDMKQAKQLFRYAGILAAVLLLITNIQAQGTRETHQKYEYMIPMRDGTKLYTAVYVPKDKPGKHPILLERTPYGAGPYGPENYRYGFRGSRKMQENGYIFAFQDVRGMGRSEGTFVNVRPQLIVHLMPHDVDESTDTYDTVEFLIKNVPDNNERVGLWGISYPGFYAAVGGINSHPALKAISPQAPVSDWFIGDDFHHNGALFLMDSVRFARFGQSRSANRPPAPRLNIGSDAYKFYLEAGSLANLTERYFADTDGMWKYLMEHGTYDEYWQSRSVPHVMKNVKCAVMTVGGWFDAEDCWGALNTYQGTERLNKNTPNTLVMGPWWHGMWASQGGNRFHNWDFEQPTSQYYQDNIEFPFFDNYLRGDGKKPMAEAIVFQTGANKWRSFREWPPREAKEVSIYFAPSKTLSLKNPPVATGPGYDEYISDPANPVPHQGGTIRTRTREYMVDDQRFAAARSDVLTYQTAPLEKELTIAGPIIAELYVSTTGTDADFIVKVIDVYPDDAPGDLAGYQRLVRGEVMRAKFRHSFQNPSPLTPGKVERVAFELPDICHTFLKGHRLMVQVQSSWFPLVDRNPQQFIDIYRCKPEDFQKATIRLYHSGESPSRLKVRVLE